MSRCIGLLYYTKIFSRRKKWWYAPWVKVLLLILYWNMCENYHQEWNKRLRKVNEWCDPCTSHYIIVEQANTRLPCCFFSGKIPSLLSFSRFLVYYSFIIRKHHFSCKERSKVDEKRKSKVQQIIKIKDCMISVHYA